MFKQAALAATAALAALSFNAQAALQAGDLAFTAFNADEDGFALVALADIAANTTVFFSDNEWTGSAFNTGESYSQWVSGGAVIQAGTVIRFSAVDSATNLAASVGNFSRLSVSGNSNWGLSNSNETLYAYLGSSATAPTTFLAAVTNGSFEVDGPLTGTGLAQGVNAIRLNANATSATPDYAEYTGVRSGQGSFASYLPALVNPSNWVVDTTNGNYAGTVPNTAAFSIKQTPAVPEPESMALVGAGLAVMGSLARRRRLV